MASEGDPLLPKMSLNNELHEAEVVWDYEEALDQVGVGRYQILQWSLLLFVALSGGINNMATVFEAGTTGYSCLTNHNFTNANGSEPQILYYPDRCSYNMTRFYSNGTNITENGLHCSSYVYDDSIIHTSIISEWQLTCDKESIVSLCTTMYMAGFCTGCLTLGYLSDRFGRRMLLLIGILVSLAAGVGAAFSPNVYVFMVMKFFIGVGVAGTRNSSYILGVELTPRKHRGTVCLLSDLVIALGTTLPGFIFYLDPRWRRFQLYIGAYHVVYLLYIFFLPESPRWLISRSRHNEALKYFKASSKFNNKPLPPKLTIQLPGLKGHEKSNSLGDLVKRVNLLIITILICILWFLSGLNYFGISWNVSNLHGNIIINSIILGSIEIASNVAALWVIRIGRRPALCLSFLIASVAMLIILFVQTSYWAVIILATIGKFAISPGITFLYVITSELYPVQVRNLALGMGSAGARIAGATAPFVIQSFDTWNALPYIIFTSTSLIGLLLSLLLPETKDRRLPDSVDAAAKMNKINKFCCRKDKNPDIPPPTEPELPAD